jgi:hypothetical protein
MQLQWRAAKGTRVKKIATPLHKAESVLWCNKAKFEKRVQRCYRIEFVVDPPSKPSIYEEFCKTGCLRKRKSHLLQNVWMKLEYHSAHTDKW